MAKRVQSGRREEMKGGTQRRMAMAFRWVRLERPLCSAWTRRVRFPGVRALGGSSARRLGGLTGRQLTGPVAEAPEVNLRRSARSDHETELAARSPGGADANSSFFVKQSSRKKISLPSVITLQSTKYAHLPFDGHSRFVSVLAKREVVDHRRGRPPRARQGVHQVAKTLGKTDVQIAHVNDEGTWEVGRHVGTRYLHKSKNATRDHFFRLRLNQYGPTKHWVALKVKPSPASTAAKAAKKAKPKAKPNTA